MEIKFIELFAGIGGFRLGFEKAEKDYQTQIWKASTGLCLRSKRDSSNINTRSSWERSSSFKNNVSSRQFSTQSRKTGNKKTSLERYRSGIADKDRTNTGEFRCIWANEIDKYACQIYRKNFGNKELIEGDIKSIPTKSIPDFDLLTAGFPCQSFSIAGKRKGFRDTRGTLFFEICRIVEKKKPDFLLLENVKGLLNHDGGNTFRIILNSLSELGYDCEWEVLNSKNFGVPQNRPRIFIVGHLRGTGEQKIFPLGETDSIYPETDEQIIHAIDSNYHKGWLDNQQRTMVYDVYNQGLRKKQNLAGTLKGEGISNTSLGTTLILRNGRDNRSCLRSGRIPELGVKGLSIRRLTPTECERLQGFPDGWTEGLSDTQRYKCLGNAVTVNVIEEIGKQIKKIQKGN